MNVAAVAGVLVATLVAAWWMTGRWRTEALARDLLDIPNDRSSHVVATPRGGGIAIVAAVLIALPVLAWLDAVTWTTVVVFWAAGVPVTVIGLIDDRGHVPQHWRLGVHFSAAALVVVLVGGLPALPVFGTMVDLGWVGHGLSVLYLVWLLNLTNFMDGIDGLAAIEVITVCVVGAVLAVLTAGSGSVWPAPLTLAAAAAGFLIWNWPPARIFMGDAGSGFLGLSLGILSLEAASVRPELFWSWTILLAVFVTDTTVALVRRAARRVPLWEAHRTHAYQHAIAPLGGHRAVTLSIAALNLVWLTPLAWLVARGMLDGAAGVIVAYTPMVGLAVWLRAGVPADSRAAAITTPTHHH